MSPLLRYWLILFLEITAIYREDHVKGLNIMWQNTEYRVVLQQLPLYFKVTTSYNFILK
jgi:hypothetical protein